MKEINAFALPGGPMFVNRGMFDAAADEGEVVGVMAHELSHVLLRHGTANASKAQNPWLQLGQIAGVVGGAVVGGAAGSAIAQGSQFGLGTLLLQIQPRLREAGGPARRADHGEGRLRSASARAHVRDDRERGKSSGGGAPQWMSSHPDPGNRTQYITKEARSLTIATPPTRVGSGRSRKRLRRCRRPRPRPSCARCEGRGQLRRHKPLAPPVSPSRAPSSQYKSISGGKVFQASVPSNWTSLSSNSPIKAVPENGYGQLNGQTAFTHGVEFGIARASTRDLREATNAWLKAVAQNNPGIAPRRSISSRSRSRSVRRSARRSSILRRSVAASASACTRRFSPMARCSTT